MQWPATRPGPTRQILHLHVNRPALNLIPTQAETGASSCARHAGLPFSPRTAVSTRGAWEKGSGVEGSFRPSVHLRPSGSPSRPPNPPRLRPFSAPFYRPRPTPPLYDQRGPTAASSAQPAHPMPSILVPVSLSRYFFSHPVSLSLNLSRCLVISLFKTMSNRPASAPQTPPPCAHIGPIGPPPLPACAHIGPIGSPPLPACVGEGAGG
jgi:hypothetical protein